jgi:hypothetical protein
MYTAVATPKPINKPMVKPPQAETPPPLLGFVCL